MVQCFVEQKNGFQREKTPELLYMSRINAEDCVHPRIMHAHEDFVEILLVRDGEGYYTINGKRYQVKKGDLILLNSGVIHDEYGSKVSNYACAVSNIFKDGLRENAVIRDSQVPVIPAGDSFGVIDGILSQMFYLLCGDLPGAEECCQHLLDALLKQIGCVLRKPLEDEKGFDTDRGILAEQIKDYIDHNYMNDVNLQTISKELNVSLYYLAHTFKEFYGYSPMQYMLRRRIGEAQSLLIGTDLTVTRIAMLVGYGNPNHFNTIFSKNVGISPRNYRILYRDKEKENLSYAVM
ncbi:AraC family transcriptional regulator [Anaerostipes sp.]|uniref:AraC family transcriptional regulator n=1 Tax=Anaerostipes sp. TaxID=1872530 RepID=UPI0025B8B6DC|nr:AraC family transcriptional regulator [Anaerostipes sp.]MBS7009881.1 helix-turn-helix transcriptional regulator [Anaerostipes sp.]